MHHNLDNYDYFVFAEEDMLLTISHLNAFISQEKRLKAAYPDTYLRYFTGFLRYEDSEKGQYTHNYYIKQSEHLIDIIYYVNVLKY